MKPIQYMTGGHYKHGRLQHYYYLMLCSQLPYLWSVGFHDIEVEWTSPILQLQGQFLFTLVIYCIHLFHYFIIK